MRSKSQLSELEECPQLLPRQQPGSSVGGLQVPAETPLQGLSSGTRDPVPLLAVSVEEEPWPRWGARSAAQPSWYTRW